jgi:beta-ribofuranosylaminobenzene 5'-phosphate synthase
LTAIQQVGFKRIEIDLQQTIIKNLMDIALKSGAAGVGMSSFGPTTYALVSSHRQANNVINSMKTALDAEKIAGQLFITHVNNIGASIEVEK